MLHRKNRNLHVVREPEDPTDEIIDRIMDELNSEDGRLPDMEEEIRKRKIKFRRKVILIAAAVIAAVVGVYLLINLQTYSEVRTVDTYGNGKTANNGYAQFGDGVLKYSRDGIAYLNQKGEEEWNQSYQIKTPVIDVCEEAAAVADKGGNDIVVFQEEGTKGEIHTTMPIEKINVSKQGIVSAILKGDGITKIMCYDTAGNVLVEHKTSLSGTGYPLDVTLSSDGETMQVLYLYTQAGSITSKVVYYNFGKAGEDKADHQVAMETYENTIMAAGFYMNDSVSVAVGDNCLVIYQGGDKSRKNG